MPNIGGYDPESCRAAGGQWMEGQGCYFADEDQFRTPSPGSIGGPPAPPLDSASIRELEETANAKGVILPWQQAGLTYDLWQQQQAANRAIDLEQNRIALELQKRQLEIGGASNAVGWGNLQQRQNEFAYQQGQDALKVQYDMAVQKWREATDMRDFQAQQHWATRADELSRMRFQEDQRQFNEQKELTKGNTLLGLGSRPDTLMKYLYALRGKMTPQGSPTLQDLPGYGQPPAPIPGGGGGTPGGGTAPNPGGGAGVGPDGIGLGPDAFEPKPDATTVPLIYNTPPAPGLPDPNMGGGRMLTPAEVAAPQVGGQRPNIAEGQKPKALAPNGLLIYEEGGPIPEPVVGVGQQSGQMYQFGEKGPEVVVPRDKVPKDLFERLMQDSGEVEYSENDGKKTRKVKVNRYAQGGLIGYNKPKPGPGGIGDEAMPPEVRPVNNYEPIGVRERIEPDRNPFSGPQVGGGMPDPRPRVQAPLYDPSVPRYENSGVFQGQFAGQPTLPGGVPNFPQVQQMTGGGGLIPSLQRFFQASPTEQSFYRGYLQDVEGVNPDDVLEAAQRLGPQVTGLRQGRYVR